MHWFTGSPMSLCSMNNKLQKYYSRFWQHNSSIVWYIFNHYTVCPNLHIITDGDLGKDLCTRTYQHVITYSYSTMSYCYLLKDGTIFSYYSIMPHDYAIQTMRQIGGG